MTADADPIQERLAWAVAIAREAGDETLKYFRQPGLKVELKSDSSPVTLADRSAEALLRKRISEKFPEDGVLGEELGTTGQLAVFRAMLDRRAKREPLQYITGHAPFRYLDLKVGPGVFIPRPETETVVQAGLDWLTKNGMIHPCVVDLCAGSGAIGLSVVSEVPGSQVWAESGSLASARSESTHWPCMRSWMGKPSLA